jgi:hypothetical protein
VSVHVSPVEGLCLAGGGGLAQQVLVPAGSARPVAFSVVPTAAAAVSLKVVARGSFEFAVGDAVSKVLQIEVSGAPPNPGPQAPSYIPHSTLLAGPGVQYLNPTVWALYISYNCVPTLSIKFKFKVLGALAGQAVVLCDLSQPHFPRNRRKEPNT